MDDKNSLADLEARMIADTIWLRAEFFRRVATLTAREVAVLAALPGPDAYRSVDAWRDEGRIFSVRRETQDLYPAFQFGTEMQPLPIIAELLATLRQYKARTDWDNALWFVGANGWLDGPPPIDLLTAEPDLVKDAAEQEVLPHIE